MYSDFIYKEKGKFNKLLKYWSDVMCYAHKHGLIGFTINNYCINQESFDLLSLAVEMIKNGICTEYFDFVIESKFFDKIVNSCDVSRDKIFELVLIKKLVLYLRNQMIVEFYELLNSLCDYDISYDIAVKLEAEFNIELVNFSHVDLDMIITPEDDINS